MDPAPGRAMDYYSGEQERPANAVGPAGGPGAYLADLGSGGNHRPAARRSSTSPAGWRTCRMLCIGSHLLLVAVKGMT